jgi:topoisomerase-4 subunit A
MGNIVTRNPAHKVTLKEKGLSTLGGRKIWFDDSVNRLNDEGRGKFLGEFGPAERILVVTKTGFFRTTGFDLTNHYEDNILLIEKLSLESVFSAIYWDSEQGFYYVKRFSFEESERLQCFIHESPDSKLVSLTEMEYPRFEISFGGKHQARQSEIIEVAEFIGIKGYKAKGKRLSSYTVDNIQELEPVVKREADPLPPVIEEEPEVAEEEDELPKIVRNDDPAQMKLEL